MNNYDVSEKEICLHHCDYMITKLKMLKGLLCDYDDATIQANAYRASCTMDCIMDCINEFKLHLGRICSK